MLWGSYHGSNYNGVYGFLENMPINMAEGNSQKNNLLLMPNPSSGVFVIKHANGLHQVSIFNATGKLVFKSIENSSTVIVDLQHLGKGIYFVEAQDMEMTPYHQKIIIQ